MDRNFQKNCDDYWDKLILSYFACGFDRAEVYQTWLELRMIRNRFAPATELVIGHILEANHEAV